MSDPKDSQPSRPPCSDPEARQFDFWIGEWDCTWEGGRATNRIEAIMGGCVILERFDGRPGLELDGMSVSVWNPVLRRWQQTWVDSWGSYFALTGEFRDGRMGLSCADTREAGTMLRMLFENITADGLDWSWSRSGDAGATWEPLWELRYSRRSP